MTAAGPGATKPLPAKAAPTSSAGDEDDIAALLLSGGDDGPTPAEGMPQVPEGSTVHDLKVAPEGGEGEEAKEGAEQAKEKAKAALGNTSNAAKSILEKMMRRPRQQQ
jgi:hypothetical protein